MKRYVVEASRDDVEAALGSGRPVISRLTQVEVMSALCRREREGALSIAQREAAWTQLHEDIRDFDIVELSEAVASAAEGLLQRHPLRAFDAVQLASCLLIEAALGHPVRFLAYDDRLNLAAAAEGLTRWTRLDPADSGFG